MAPDTSSYLNMIPSPTATTVYYYSNYQVEEKIVESDKQKKARIAKERMFASWQVYNKKTVSIKEVVQICKPRHRINHSGRRY